MGDWVGVSLVLAPMSVQRALSNLTIAGGMVNRGRLRGSRSGPAAIGHVGTPRASPLQRIGPRRLRACGPNRSLRFRPAARIREASLPRRFRAGYFDLKGSLRTTFTPEIVPVTAFR